MKMRWMSSGFKGSGSSEESTATTGNQVGKGGSDKQAKDASLDGFFVLDVGVGGACASFSDDECSGSCVVTSTPAPTTSQLPELDIITT